MEKPSRTFYDTLSYCYIGISLFTLGLLAVLTFNFPPPAINFPMKQQLTGSIFSAICLLGIIFGVFPSSCSRIRHFRSRDKNSEKTKQANSKMTTYKFKGHHPTCRNFSAHILQIGTKTYCAGCTGLIIGAIISLLGSILYFFLNFKFIEGPLLFSIGFIGVFCSLLQHHIFRSDRGVIHFFLNIIFVLGTFLLLTGVNEIMNNFLLELYLFTLIIYWIITRIMLSQLNHNKICTDCGLKPCSYI